jgi:hypothetical protein
MSEQGFWEQVGVQALGGAATAVVAALLAILVAYLITRRYEQQAAQRARDAAGAEEFYRAYGNLFAVWKEWDAHTDKGSREAQPADQAAFLARVADAEGQLESFLVRLTLERDLDVDGEEVVVLWCFRRGCKVVRYSVRRNKRVPWFRAPGDDPPERAAGHLHYKMFKRLTVAVAEMIADAPGSLAGRRGWPWRRRVGRRRGRPEPAKAADSLNMVTSTSSWVRRRYELGKRPKDQNHQDDDLWFRVGARLFPEAAEPDDSYGLHSAVPSPRSKREPAE